MNRKAYITLFLFAKKKTCAKRKMNRKLYIARKTNGLHSSISLGESAEGGGAIQIPNILNKM